MDDNRNYIEQTQARAMAIEGKEFTPDELARTFAKNTLNDRVEILDALDRDMRLRSDEPLTVREAARKCGEYDRYVTALRNTHEKLRKIDR